MPFHTAFQRQPKWVILLGVTALISGIGWVDFLTGRELSLFVFYAIPILIGVSYVDLRFGIGCALFSSLIWWTANHASNPYQTRWGYTVATLGRTAYFLFVAIGGAAIKSRRDLDRSRIEALEQTRLLEQEIVRVSEHEQQRIGQDLHDGLCPHLAAIGFATKILADDLRARQQPEAPRLEEIQTLLTEAVVLARELAHGASPVTMDDIGLPAALQALAAKTSRLTGMAVSFREEGETRIGQADTGMHLYRIAQEALNNALRHGGAKHTFITLETHPDALVMKISDDGHGFSEPVPKKSGIGLKTMSYRARTIGAELQVVSSPDSGTTVACHLPTKQALPASLA